MPVSLSSRKPLASVLASATQNVRNEPTPTKQTQNAKRTHGKSTQRTHGDCAKLTHGDKVGRTLPAAESVDCLYRDVEAIASFRALSGGQCLPYQIRNEPST